MEKIMLDDANYYTTCYKDDKKRHMVVIPPYLKHLMLQVSLMKMAFMHLF